MPIDTSNELSYEYICLLVQEYEETALKSNTRAGILAVASGTTYSVDSVLDAHERSLNRVSKTRQTLASAQASPSGGGGVQPDDSTKQPGLFKGAQLVDADIDLLSVFGGSDTPFANYLQECLGCNLRLKFDWQLKPISFLDPINKFLDQVNANIDGFSKHIDPFGNLADICSALNSFKDGNFCPQDLIIVMMALKMLLKKYVLQLFSIKLDWTTLVGPLLSGIVNGITDLLDNIFHLLAAPLDCVVSAMKASNDVLKAGRDTASSVIGDTKRVGNFFQSLGTDGVNASDFLDTKSSGLLIRKAQWHGPSPEEKEDPLRSFNQPNTPVSGYDPGYMTATDQVSGLSPKLKDNDPTKPGGAAGFVLNHKTTLPDALVDPKFGSATFLDKLIIPTRDAMQWLEETYEKTVGSLKSLSSLVGDGFSLSLQNLGAMLFILDLISMLIMIINLLKSHKNVKDWCTLIGENPSLLEDELRKRYGSVSLSRSVANPSTNEVELLIARGPDTVGVVRACLNQRTNIDSVNIQQWVADLEARGIR